MLLIAKVAEATSHWLFPPPIDRIAPNILSMLSVENFLVKTNLNYVPVANSGRMLRLMRT
jgi:hypothetical protein